jgi:hypothetical protein
MATKKVNIDIIARDKSQQALNKVRGNLDGVKKAVFNVRNALAGLGAGLAVRSLVKTGMEIESLQVRLKFLFGSAEEGAKAFDNMAKFASKVPFSLEQIQQGAGVLSVVSKDADELSDIMEITGNVAAVTGLDFRTASEQIQRSLSAGIASADLFREKGVRDLLGFKAGATVTAEETAEAFKRVFGKGGQFGDATGELAKTFEGTISMIGDKFFTFKKTILEAGFFPELKRQFGDLDKFLSENTDTIEEFAIKIGEGLATAVRVGASAIILLKDNFDLLVTATKLFISFKIATVFIGLSSAIFKANAAMLTFNATIKRNLFIAAGAIVISQFDKILEVLGKFDTDFKSFSAAIAQNNSLIKTNQNALGTAKGALKSFLDMYPDAMKENHLMNDQYLEQIAVIKDLEERIKALKEDNEALFKEGYPVYEDRILRIAKGLDRQKKSTKDTTESTNELIESTLEEIKTIDILQKAREKLATNQNVFNAIKERGMSELELVDKRMKDELALVKESQIQLQLIRDNAIAEGLMSERMANTIYADEMANLENIKNQILVDGKNARIDILNQEAKETLDTMQRNYDEQLAILRSGKFAELDLEKLSTEQKKDLAKTAGRDLLGQLAQNNKKAFQINKALNYAEAIMNTATGVTKFIREGNLIMAAIVGGLGAIQIAKIANTQYQGRAGGGAVNKDQPYMVGEKGPEMFVPSGSGKIVPNNQLASPQPVNVNFNINTVDARGFNELLVNSRGLIVNMINSAVNEKGRQAIV